MKSITDFYTNDEKNPQGRTYLSILEESDDFLEQDHLWVQWIFPTKEQSKYNKEGPILNSEMITEIKSSLETKMPIAFERIASFYALSNHWINPSNHNYLRLSRILNHFNIFGYYQYSLTLLNFLLGKYIEHPDKIGIKTLSFWRYYAKLDDIAEIL